MTSASTKTQILDIAQELMQRRGVNAVSYADISAAVGIRKASIHYYFPHKADLVVAVLQRYSSSFFDLLDRTLATSVAPEVKLRRYCDLYAATLGSGDRDKACLCGMLGAALTTLDPISAQLVQAFYRGNLQRLEQILEQGLGAGEFQFVGSVTAMATAIFAFLEGGQIVARADGGIEQYRDSIEQILRLTRGSAAKPRST
ncbi:TetR/AcrR family transcriptional regulator [Synechococcus sp. PCC 7336]|uniref:TetR/AcrR family transcriptional regulator n=1 Tax=Synechococcus sp. PCC 7336 TaxID=195250 RepID=UPI00034798A5|nr:TetR/AcrR family transcriptional regulator [Synechococcus sp. PCC 7336]